MLSIVKAAWCRVRLLVEADDDDDDGEAGDVNLMERTVKFVRSQCHQSWPASQPNRHHMLHLDFVTEEQQPQVVDDDDEVEEEMEYEQIQAWRRPLATLIVSHNKGNGNVENDLEKPFRVNARSSEVEMVEVIHRMAVAIYSFLTIQLHSTLLNEVKPSSPLGWDNRQPNDFQRNIHQRYPSRRAKLRGDLLIQLGAYSEAISVLAQTVDDCRQQGDLLWMVAAQEALHTAVALGAERDARRKSTIASPVRFTGNTSLSILNEQYADIEEDEERPESVSSERGTTSPKSATSSSNKSPPTLSLETPPPPPASLACSLLADKLALVAPLYTQQQLQGMGSACWWLVGLLHWQAGRASEAINAITMSIHHHMLPRQTAKKSLGMVRTCFIGRCLLLFSDWKSNRKVLLMYRLLAQQLRQIGLLSESALILDRALSLAIPLAIRSLLLEDALSVAMARQDRHKAIQLAWERVACLTADTEHGEQGKLWACLRRLTTSASSLSSFSGDLGLVKEVQLELVRLRRAGGASNDATFLYDPRASVDSHEELAIVVGEPIRVVICLENRLSFDLPLANLSLVFDSGEMVEAETVSTVRLARRKQGANTLVKLEVFLTAKPGISQLNISGLQFDCLGTRIFHPVPGLGTYPVIHPQPLLRLESASWSRPWLEWWEGETGEAKLSLENVSGLEVASLELSGEHPFQLERWEGDTVEFRFQAPKIGGSYSLGILYGGKDGAWQRQLTIPLTITVRPLLSLLAWAILPLPESSLCLLVMDWQGPDNVAVELSFPPIGQATLNGLTRIAWPMSRLDNLDAFSLVGQWSLPDDRRGTVKPSFDEIEVEHLLKPPVWITIESPNTIRLDEMISITVRVQDCSFARWQVEAKVSTVEPFDEAFKMIDGVMTGENCDCLHFELQALVTGQLLVEARVRDSVDGDWQYAVPQSVNIGL